MLLSFNIEKEASTKARICFFQKCNLKKHGPKNVIGRPVPREMDEAQRTIFIRGAFVGRCSLVHKYVRGVQALKVVARALVSCFQLVSRRTEA